MRSHRPRATSLFGVVAALAVIAGCGDVGSRSSRPGGIAAGAHGRLSGTLGIYGGEESAHSCGCSMEAGTLRLTNRAGNSQRVRVGASGRFDVRLPVGDYRVVGGVPRMHWPVGSCHLFSPSSDGRVPIVANYVRVRASQTTQAHIGCMGQ